MPARPARDRAGRPPAASTSSRSSPSTSPRWSVSLLGKAREKGIVEVRVHDLRDCTSDVHHTVDDTPYGGGGGMVMKAEPWGLALDDVLAAGAPGAGARARGAHPGGHAVHAGPRRGARRPSRGCSSPAAATRASTAGSWPGRRSGCRSGRSAWATTCSPAARWPPWWSSRPSPGCCPASWATPSPWSRTPTPPACSRVRSTPDPPLVAGPRGAAGARRRGPRARSSSWRARGLARAHRAGPARPAPAGGAAPGRLGLTPGSDPAARRGTLAVAPVRQIRGPANTDHPARPPQCRRAPEGSDLS